MDLKIHAPPPTTAERTAVDELLGPPAVVAHADRVRRGGPQVTRRDLLLPALHALQDRVGFLSEGGLGYVCERLRVPPADAFGVASFYALWSTVPIAPTVVHVCDDIACRRGGEALVTELGAALGPSGTNGGQTWKRSPCLGLCEQAPAAYVTRAGSPVFRTAFGNATITKIQAAFGGEDQSPSREGLSHFVPQTGSPGLKLLGRVGRLDPVDLDAHLGDGAFAGLQRALSIGPAAVRTEISGSGLTGRGGAAFPTGRKWDAVAAAPAQPHYLCCNADESEPGTFKDRVLMEWDPYAVLEGIAIAAFATGVEHAFIYIRGEYPLAEARLTEAIRRATARGLLGARLAGSGPPLTISVRRGAGAYICGEETALFESIEGKRGEPRSKPPFPVHVGLFGKPTLVNNVETLVNVPLILREGAASFAAVGGGASTGPKLFCVSGAVGRPGLYELPFGVTLREVLAVAGGTPRGLRSLLLGGAAGTFVGEEALDTPLTLEGTRKIGASLGSAVVMVFDHTSEPLDVIRRIAQFFRDESCGKCVPCRVGTQRLEELVARRLRGQPREGDELLREELGQAMRDASICGLGQTAHLAIDSGLRRLNPLPELAK